VKMLMIKPATLATLPQFCWMNSHIREKHHERADRTL
jgi:hypothetical protein